MAIFQLHTAVQRIARRPSRAVLGSPMRKQLDAADSPEPMSIRIPGEGTIDVQAIKMLDVPKR